ncbi:MAG TPA: hypothetical protein VN969_10905 [Streptosporangiaceae bacterium]|nr:hypothetical protein [Streptosporangiaceae bacterium]
MRGEPLGCLQSGALGSVVRFEFAERGQHRPRRASSLPAMLAVARSDHSDPQAPVQQFRSDRQAHDTGPGHCDIRVLTYRRASLPRRRPG